MVQYRIGNAVITVKGLKPEDFVNDDDNDDQVYRRILKRGNIYTPTAIKEEHRQRWLITDDICGLITAIITQIIIAFAACVVSFSLLNPVGRISHFILLGLYLALAVLASVSHLQAMLTNPGTVTLPESTFQMEKIDKKSPKEINNEFVTNCIKCNNYKPARAHHCSTCKRCIRRMDHHCPWINNCVGQFNQKFFIQFVMYILLLSLSTMGLTAWRAYDCSQSRWAECKDITDSGVKVATIVILLFISLLFALFTATMLYDQISNIKADSTGIENLQESGRSVSLRSDVPYSEAIADSCGAPFGVDWFLPIQNSVIAAHDFVFDEA